MRSIRVIFAIQEGLTFVAAVLFIIVLSLLLQSGIKKSYARTQASQINLVDRTIDNIITDNMSLLREYMEMPQGGGSHVLLHDFSDIYYCNAQCIVTSVVKKEAGSVIFPGYDLGRSSVCRYLQKRNGDALTHSALIRSPETGRTSVYISAEHRGGRIVGRIGIDRLRQNLVRIARVTNSVILLATNDGYILASSREPLPFYSLPGHSGDEISFFGTGHLYGRKKCATLANDIAVLTPLTPLYGILSLVRGVFIVFIAVTFAITIVRTVLQTVYIVKPLANFSAMINSWGPDTMPRALPRRILDYREMASLYRSFTERTLKIQQVMSALRESEEKFRTTVSAMTDLVFVFDDRGRFTFYHAPDDTELFLKPADFLGKNPDEIMPTEIAEKWKQAFESNRLGRPADFDYAMDICGEMKWYSLRLSPNIVGGEFRGSIAVVRDITRRKNEEDLALRNLAEKEILLKEIHHRVKNNLSVIMSLLNLQAANISSKDNAIEAFRESANRILSMALVHEKLYRSTDFSRVDFKEYMNMMIPGIVSSYNVGNSIETVIEIEDISLDINKAIPCGLILNELVSNALKYAFKNRETGRIKCSLRALGDNTIEFTVSDNGNGLPEGFQVEKAESLGMKLVYLLTVQIRGKLSIESKPGEGARFTIVFSE